MGEVSQDIKDKRSKALYVGVIVLLCLVFIVGFVYGLNTVLALEGTMVPDEDTHGVFTQPKTSEEVIEFLNTAYKSSDVGVNHKVENGISYKVDSDSIETDGSSQLKDALVFMKGKFEDCLEANSTTHSTDFTEKANLRRFNFTDEDIESFECKYFDRNYVYQCNSCDNESDVFLSECDKCPGTEVYEKKTRDNYYVCINLKPTEKLIADNYPQLSETEISALISDEIGDKALSLSDFDCQIKSFKVILEVDRATGNIDYLAFEKNMDIFANVIFGDYLSDVAKASIKFNLTQKDDYSFTWAGIKLSDDTLVIEPKNTDNLTATLICDDPLKYNAIWSISDENVATVDEDGYIKAGKEPGEAVVTATYEYNGVTYTDSCRVLVRVPVESMKMSKRSAKLNVGDTLKLKATVSPSNASVKTVKWYSEDENVATVDENGVVTALKSGITVVYALSDDGYYKSTCEVNIK